jgi:DNA-binding XRE family transcriptional regulator
MTATLNQTIDAASQRIEEEIQKRLRELPGDVLSDFMELLSLLRKEENDAERAEIAKTMMEIIFPQSIKKAIIADEKLAEEAAARERVDAYRRKVGERIRQKREEAGLTQMQLAEMTQLPQPHICRLEQGKHAPTFTTIERLATALKVSPGDLDPGFPDE